MKKKNEGSTKKKKKKKKKGRSITKINLDKANILFYMKNNKYEENKI